MRAAAEGHDAAGEKSERNWGDPVKFARGVGSSGANQTQFAGRVHCCVRAGSPEQPGGLPSDAARCCVPRGGQMAGVQSPYENVQGVDFCTEPHADSASAAANAATQASGRDRSVIGQCVSGSNRAVKWRSTAGACVMR